MVVRKYRVIFVTLIILTILNIDITFAESSKPFDPPVTSGRITSLYGRRYLFGRTFHYGIDIAVPTGTPVYASESGVVSISRYAGGYGYLIEIQHEGELNDFKTRYAHNSRLVVNVGQRVNKGQVVAYSGNTGDSTGPHVHFEVRRSNSPLDPLLYTDFSNFDHSGVPSVGIGDVTDIMVDFIVMGLENMVVFFFNTMEERVMNPLMSRLPMILKVDLDISNVVIVENIHRIVKSIAFLILPFIILFYVIKMTALNLVGEKKEFINHTFFKFFKAGIFMQFSLTFTGIYLGIATSIIFFFVRYVDSDYSKIMYSYETVTELFSSAGINMILSVINFFVYFILFIVVLIRIIDLALISVLTPLVIPFAEFFDNRLYKQFISEYIGIPVAQFVTVLCFAFAIGFAEISIPTSTIKNLDFLGRFIVSISSAIYALIHPSKIKRIFHISAIDIMSSFLIAIKGALVINNRL